MTGPTTRRWPVVALLFAVLLWSGSVARAGDDLYEFVIEDGTGLLNETAEVVVKYNSADGEAIAGYSMAVCHDELVSVAEDGVANGATVDDLEIFLHSLTIFDEGWSVGVAFQFMPKFVLDPGDDYEMYLVTYDLGDELGEAELTWCEIVPEMGPAQKSTVVDEDLIEILVGEGLAVVDGSIEIIDTPPLELAAGSGELVISSNGNTIEEAEVTISMSNDDPDLAGVGAISFGVAHDGDRLELIEINLENTVVGDTNGGDGPEVFITNLSPDGGDGGTVAIVISLEETPFDTIDEGVGHAICNLVYAGGDDVEGGDSIGIDITGSLGDPPVRLVVSVEGVSHIPVPQSGTVTVTEVLVVTHSFLRGDVNSSGGVELADGIRLLNVLFNEAPIACAETADINGDGSLRLNDGILLLNFLFNEGSPPAGGGDCESVEEDLCAEDTPSCD